MPTFLHQQNLIYFVKLFQILSKKVQSSAYGKTNQISFIKVFYTKFFFLLLFAFNLINLNNADCLLVCHSDFLTFWLLCSSKIWDFLQKHCQIIFLQTDCVSSYCRIIAGTTGKTLHTTAQAKSLRNRQNINLLYKKV